MTDNDRDDVWPPIEKGRAVPGADHLGVWLFLISLGIPFLVVIGSYFILRAYSETWGPADVDAIPAVLWISTVSIVLVSVFSHLSVKWIRVDQAPRAKSALLVASLCVAIFSLCQVIAWEQMRVSFADLGEDLRPYKVGFYLMTGFHALHVVGGMILQGWVLTQSFRARYWSLYHPGLRYAAWYWHFLDGLWIAIFVALLCGR